jgi:hypothetical protein
MLTTTTHSKQRTDLDPFQVIQVDEYMQKHHKNCTYDMQPGNDCIWVSYRAGSSWIHMYFIFKNSQIIDIQID